MSQLFLEARRWNATSIQSFCNNEGWNSSSQDVFLKAQSIHHDIRVHDLLCAPLFRLWPDGLHLVKIWSKLMLTRMECSDEICCLRCHFL
ncbi:hypothetical protein ES319_D04G053500v1 [Gossypium barbadense]|uniref:Uncharacterized protein n=2 Tax=Gossypium TaxID=3633 RepID=A0A5J5RS77_GOSBA|nr:hypothetical protein ES319_D04G053500v1 [Gossypium barbadense]TYG72902.1 hypothetical protein ES288_D04G057200v1 [Gossypium darwinii]